MAQFQQLLYIFCVNQQILKPVFNLRLFIVDLTELLFFLNEEDKRDERGLHSNLIVKKVT